MKEIEKAMVNAIRNEKTWSLNNTSVHCYNGRVVVRLHGNVIAVREAAGAPWKFTLAGWNTPTTRSRLRALGCDVYCKDFTPYRNGRQWWSDFE